MNRIRCHWIWQHLIMLLAAIGLHTGTASAGPPNLLLIMSADANG